MWKDFDEELYQALLLEQRLSSEGPRLLTCPQPSSFHCKLSEIRIMSSQMEWAFIKLRGRGHVGDPLHPVTIIMLALWIPVNIIYLGFQALKHLLATRAVIEPLHDGTVRALPAGLEVSSLYVTHNVRYPDISSIGYYANGLRINCGRAKLVIESQSQPSLFVALTHLAPAASIKSGLNVPEDFPVRCSAEGRSLDPGKMHRNPPTSWKPVANNFKLPIPTRRIVAYYIIVILVLTALPVLIGK